MSSLNSSQTGSASSRSGKAGLGALGKCPCHLLALHQGWRQCADVFGNIWQACVCVRPGPTQMLPKWLALTFCKIADSLGTSQGSLKHSESCMVPRLASSLSRIGRWHSLPKGDWSVFPGIWKRTEINFVWQVPHHSFEMLTAFLGIEWKPAFDVDPWDISGFPTRKKEHVKTREFSVQTITLLELCCVRTLLFSLGHFTF